MSAAGTGDAPARPQNPAQASLSPRELCTGTRRCLAKTGSQPAFSPFDTWMSPAVTGPVPDFSSVMLTGSSS